MIAAPLAQKARLIVTSSYGRKLPTKVHVGF
jgi:hypothetical protein